MPPKQKNKKRSCFVVSAIGKPKTVIRRRADIVLNDIIQEALNIPSLNYKA